MGVRLLKVWIIGSMAMDRFRKQVVTTTFRNTRTSIRQIMLVPRIDEVPLEFI